MTNTLILMAETNVSSLYFCSKTINEFENTFATLVNEFIIDKLIQGSIFLKNGYFIIQERFDKLISDINTLFRFSFCIKISKIYTIETH